MATWFEKKEYRLNANNESIWMRHHLTSLGFCVAAVVLVACDKPKQPQLPPIPQSKSAVVVAVPAEMVMSAAIINTGLSLSAIEPLGAFIAAPVRPENRGVINLEWNASTDPTTAGYRLYFGTTPRGYMQSPDVQSADVGNKTKATLKGLLEGTRYYIAAASYDSNRVEGPLSAEISAVTAIFVGTTQERWSVFSTGMLGMTNEIQQTTNLTDWRPILTWVGTGGQTNVLHTNIAHSWFRVVVK